MKKIYFLFIALIFSSLLYAQDTEPPELSCPADIVVQNDLGETGADVDIPVLPGDRDVDVLLVYADGDSNAQDVQTKLLATGKIDSVALRNASGTTPTLSELEGYDAVLVWRLGFFPDEEALGDVLVDYIEGGGGVVVSMYALVTSIGESVPTGAFESDEYRVIVPDFTKYGPTDTLGQLHLPDHPLLDNVSTFNGGDSDRSNSSTLTTDAFRVADWGDGLPLIAAKENVGSANARRVDLNFFPPSADEDATYWDTATDGDEIMANALVWVANAPPEDAIAVEDNTSDFSNITVSNDFNSQASPSGFYPIGTTTVTVTAVDEASNSSTCSFSVTVEDTIAPTVTCKDATLNLDASGTVTVTPLDVLDSASDNSGIDTMTVAPEVFVCSDTETTQTVTLTVTDFGGNSSTCTSMVTIEDNLAPTASCQDITVELDAAGQVSITPDMIDNGSSDNCSIDTMWVTPENFVCSDVGTPQTVTLTVQDGSGNSDNCTATVTIEDNVSPDAVCQNITVELDAAGQVSITADMIDNGSSDACGIDTMWLDTYDFDCTNLGDNTVTLTVEDVNGNTSTCPATVTVEDNAGPVLNCLDITVYLRPNGQYVLRSSDIEDIALGGGTTNDNCTSVDDFTLEVFPRSFDCVHVNTAVEVTVSATDSHGNTSKCKANVTVLDTFSAEVTCVDTIDVYLDENGEARIFPGYIEDEIIEEGSCGAASSWLDKQVFGCEDLGANTVTLTVADGSGNESSCTSTVNVHDTIVPVVEEIEDIEVVLDPGVCETEIDYPTPVYSDNCDVTLEQTEGLGPDAMFPLGITTETWQITDASGNMAMVTFDVVVTTTNDPPTLDSIGNVTVEEDTPQITVELTGISSGNDCVTQDDTVYVENSNSTLITNVMLDYTGGATGSVVMDVAAEASGEAQIDVTVEDSQGASITRTFMLTVTEVNDAPVVVNPIPDQVVNASYVLKVPIMDAMGVIFNDIDDDELTYSIMLEGGADLPSWMTWEDDTLTAQPMIADTGCVTVVLEATDAAGATASDEFEVCVEGYPVNAENFANKLSVNVYPNPTSGRVNIELNSSAILHDVDLSVHDVTGRRIMHKQYRASERISFNLNENVSGMYFIKLNVGGNQILKKVILDR